MVVSPGWMRMARWTFAERAARNLLERKS